MLQTAAFPHLRSIVWRLPAIVKTMQPPENDPSNSLTFVPDPFGPTDNPLSATAMDKRLSMLEHMMADSINRLDQVQHLVELWLSEAHARRRADGVSADGKTAWSDAGFTIIRRNMLVDFGTPRDNETVNTDDFLASVWYAREAWGVWGRDAYRRRVLRWRNIGVGMPP